MALAAGACLLWPLRTSLMSATSLQNSCSSCASYEGEEATCTDLVAYCPCARLVQLLELLQENEGDI